MDTFWFVTTQSRRDSPVAPISGYTAEDGVTLYTTESGTAYFPEGMGGGVNLSQITASSTSPAPTDGFVAVQAGNIDRLIPFQAVGATPPNAQSGTTYTLALGDAGGVVEMNNASANTVTVPTNASIAFIVGCRITIVQTGAGTTTIAAAGGVTLLGSVLTTAGQYAGVTIYQRDANSWVVLQ